MNHRQVFVQQFVHKLPRGRSSSHFLYLVCATVVVEIKPVDPSYLNKYARRSFYSIPTTNDSDAQGLSNLVWNRPHNIQKSLHMYHMIFQISGLQILPGTEETFPHGCTESITSQTTGMD